jgi:hypothetical protein
MSTPKGAVHAFEPVQRARSLDRRGSDIVFVPDVAVVINADGPPDKAALLSVMSKYGLVPAAPK